MATVALGLFELGLAGILFTKNLVSQTNELYWREKCSSGSKLGWRSIWVAANSGILGNQDSTSEQTSCGETARDGMHSCTARLCDCRHKWREKAMQPGSFSVTHSERSSRRARGRKRERERGRNSRERNSEVDMKVWFFTRF